MDHYDTLEKARKEVIKYYDRETLIKMLQSYDLEEVESMAADEQIAAWGGTIPVVAKYKEMEAELAKVYARRESAKKAAASKAKSKLSVTDAIVGLAKAQKKVETALTALTKTTTPSKPSSSPAHTN